MNRARVYFASAALASAMLVAGCGGSSSASSETSAPADDVASAVASSPITTASDAASTFDVCTIINTDQIAAVIGKDPGTSTSSPGSCSFPDAPVEVYGMGSAAFDQLVDKFAELYAPEQKADVTGIGDRAVMFTSDDGSARLVVLSGDVTFGAAGTSQADAIAIVNILLDNQKAGQKGTP